MTIRDGLPQGFVYLLTFMLNIKISLSKSVNQNMPKQMLRRSIPVYLLPIDKADGDSHQIS